MNKIITNGELKAPRHTIAEEGQTEGAIVSLETFLEMDDRTDTGVWLDSHEEVESIADIIEDIPVIALNFPVFTDGRAFSSANILRRKYNYTREIRAIGDVRVDQLEQMQRCGFDSFHLAENQDAEKAMGVLLSGYSNHYQATVSGQALFDSR